jgi:hypothetical protein
MNLYAAANPKATGQLWAAEAVSLGAYEIAGSVQAQSATVIGSFGYIEQDTTVNASSATLSGEGWRIVVDTGDWEYLRAQSATVSGDVAVTHDPVSVVIPGGSVQAQSMTLSGIITVTPVATPEPTTWTPVPKPATNWLAAVDQ